MKASPTRRTDSIEHGMSHSTAAWSHSARSMAMICSADSSQKSWPSFFSCHAMWCRSTKSRKSLGPKRASAERQKSGFCDRKFVAFEWMLVKLQRPPPEMRIFSPTIP